MCKVSTVPTNYEFNTTFLNIYCKRYSRMTRKDGSRNTSTPNAIAGFGYSRRDGGRHGRGQIQPRDQVHFGEVQHKPAVYERGPVYQEESDRRRKAAEVLDLGYGRIGEVHVAGADVLPERGNHHTGLRRHERGVVQESQQVDDCASGQQERWKLHRPSGEQDRHVGPGYRAGRDQQVLQPVHGAKVLRVQRVQRPGS